MDMDRLPKDVLMRIGDLLPDKDRIACTVAAKCFNAIHMNYNYHHLTLDNTNVSVGLARLSETARYVTRLKPRLAVLEIIYDRITDPSLIVAPGPCLPNAFFTTQLHFKNCAASVIDKVLAMFTWPSTKLMVTSDIGLTGKEAFLREDEPRVISSIVTVLCKKNLDILKNRRVCMSRKIVLVTHFDNDDGNVVIDLSHVDTQYNQILIISNFNEKMSTMNYIDAWKITKFADQRRHYDCGRRDNEGIALSLSQYAKNKYADKRQEIRMNTFIITGDLNAHDDTLIDIAKALPKHVEWHVSVRTPEDLAYLDQMKKVGVEKFKYMCVDRETHMSALLIKKLMGPEFDFHIKIAVIYDADQSLASCSASDIYNAMCEFTKRKWFTVWKVAMRT